MFKKMIIFILIVFSHFIYSNDEHSNDDAYKLAAITSEPSANIANAVNAITGDYFISETDLIIEGCEPIVIHPTYLSKNGKDNWYFLNHLTIEYYTSMLMVSTTEPNGVTLTYDCSKMGRSKKIKNSGSKNDENRKRFNENTFEEINLLEASYKGGLTNSLNFEISGRQNIKNNRVLMNLNANKIKINCSNGTVRYYEKYKIENLLMMKFTVPKSETVFLFHLKQEILPNQNKIIYQYDNQNNLIQIKTTNFYETKTYATLNIKQSNNQYILTSSDNKKLIYTTNNEGKFNLLTSCQFPQKPNETYRYYYDNEIKPCITERSKPQNRDFQIEYYTKGTHIVNGKTIEINDIKDPKFMRVKSIKSRAAPNGELVETYKFIYNLNQDPKACFEEGFTEVYDVNNIKTIYRFSNLRLDSIERYDENSKLKNKEILSWGKGQNATKDVTFLLSKTFLDSKNSIVFHKEFIYDTRGNVIKESFFSNLSGKNNEITFDERFSFEDNIKKAKDNLEVFSTYKTYSQDNKNLLVSQEDDNQLKIEYYYFNDTDLIKSKIIKDKNIIKIRYFYEYNSEFVLIKEIIDDGHTYNLNDLSNVTIRLIKTFTPKKDYPFINKAEVIEEKYLDLGDKKEKLIRKTILTYSNFGKIIKEEIYNSKNIKEYSIEKKYDDSGNLIEEVNPEGYVTTYDRYDENFNLLTKKNPSGKTTNFEYDLLNRLTKKEEISSDNKYHITYFSYDLNSNIISTTNYLKNTTYFKYDCFNNLVETIKPNGAIISLGYDDISRQIEIKDESRNITKTRYNGYNLPIEISYSDNTQEKFIYNLDGSLKKHTDQLDNSTIYEYDFLKRDIKKSIISFDNKSSINEEKTYSSFNLLSKKDPEGNITTYKYDYAGKKISKTTLNEETRFLYDDLSRLSTTVYVNDQNSLFEIEVKDYLNRILEQRKEDENGNIFYRIGYEYDLQNNKTKIIRYIHNYPCIEKFRYDSFNRLIEHEDALGNVDFTTYIEDSNFLQTKHIDPIKLQTIQTFDPLNRLILQEKIMDNTLVSKEEFSYDFADNLISQKSTIINLEDKSSKIVETKKEYDEMNRLKVLIEAANLPDQKVTYYSYTKKGQLFQVIKPNKIVLTYEYDYLNNNTRLFSLNNSSNQRVDYQFTYNNLGFLIEVKDNISFSTTIRVLDHKGRILKETLANNLTLENIYDKKGNKIKLILPDSSFVEYIYNPCFLNTIIRKDSKGFEKYRHEFSKYDLDGNALKQNHIKNIQMIKQFDKLGRAVQIESPFFIQTIDLFNRDGTIKQMTFSALGEKDISSYEYDPLKQLIEEKGLFTMKYSYDSHNNRLKKDNINYEINDLNQIIKVHPDEKNQEEIIYNENGNLKSKRFFEGDPKNDPKIEVFYRYDALDRLISIEKSNDYKLEFEYDAFNRRISKKYSKFAQYWFSSEWEEISNNNYLYDDQNEIGSLDKQNNFIELRILSNTFHAEIGSSIAFEINNNIYLPIHDLQGNVACLVSSTNDMELYRYSAFGEEKIYFNTSQCQVSEFKNSWRFSSKRKDESNLIYFGRRYYDSEYGR